MEKELESPYKVMYYVHDIYSNIDSYPKIKYEQILLKEEAITRAKNLLKQLKNYFYKIQKELLEKYCFVLVGFVCIILR